MQHSTTRRPRSAGQFIGQGGLLFALMSCTALTPLHSAVADEALPTGGRFTAGSGRIVEQPGGLRIEQGSRTGTVEWQGFSIGSGKSVHVENGAGATLNRVTGNLPSRIDGSLTATGSVYLVNRAGIVVGKEGRVDTGGGFYASTHDVSDAAFAAQRDLTFAGDSKAAVVNMGTIASRGGDVALIARSVRNEGRISAPKGTAALLAGYEVLAKETADAEGRFAVKVGGSDTEAVNAGTLAAANAEMRANGGSVYALAGNTGGVVKATGVAKRDGRVFLTAGDGGSVTVESPVVAQRRTGEESRRPDAAKPDATKAESTGKTAKRDPRSSRRPDRAGGDIRVSGGSVTVSGKLDASGTTGAGGTLVATGKAVVLTGKAALDVSGASGGTLLVGGDYQGGRTAATRYLAEPVATARTVAVEAGAQLRADGTRGDGGRVVVWSDGDTAFAGAVSARGTGKGGDAEVSGKARLAFTGTADLRGTVGFGTLLLDPHNLTISDAADSGMSGFSASANDSVLNVDTLKSALNYANVLVTTGDGGTQAGDITVATPLTGLTSTLTLSAHRDMIVNAAVTGSSSGSVRLKAERDIVVNAAITGGVTSDFTLLAKRDVTVNAAIGGRKVVLWSGYDGSGIGSVRFGTGATVTATGGLSIFYNPTAYTAPTDYSGIAGTGTAVTGYMLVNTAENLQAIGTNLAGTYALGRDIDAQATAGWNSGAGFAPLGSAATPFTGLFDGRDHAINGLTINRTGSDDVGLFGVVGAGGAVRDVRMVGGGVLGRNRVGALVGSNAGTVTWASATGTVSGRGDAVGGLIGTNSGTVGQSFATGAVTAQGGAVGGLIGDNAGGTVNQAYASGAVTAQGDQVGGLIGRMTGGSVTQVYALGGVTGTLRVGGLIGDNNGGTVTQTYATGAVTGQAEAGGLVGANGGTVTLSYWDTQTTGRSNATGSGVDTGMTGLTTDNARTSRPGGGASAYQGWSIGVTGQSWYMNNEASTLPDLRPIGAWEEARVGVEGYAVVTNLHQLVLINNKSPFDSRLNYLRDYWLDTDIDASATRGTNPSDIWGPRGFVPIGYQDSFAGTFDGNGHVVKGVYINREGNYKGFFKSLAVVTRRHSNVMVKNFGIVDGTVIAGSSSYLVGGMAGMLGSGIIENSYFTGSVSGGESVGGLVGTLSEASIRRSYAIASVTGSPTATTGSIGGLVGDGIESSIEQSYASGRVTGPVGTGGLVGTADGLTVTSSYWDKDTSGQQNGISNATVTGLTGLTTAEARQASSYVGWDFTKDWYQSGDMRPIGRWEAAKAGSDGIAAITNLHQLQLIDANPAGSYRLGADIDAQATSGANAAGIWGTGGFTPLAGAGFTGSFDGRGHLIRGLTINRPASDDVGLFGKIGTGGTVSNVGLDATGAVTGRNRVGAIAGTNGGTILQSFSRAGVTGQGAGTGGLAGSNSGTIRQSYAAGTVAGQGDGVGGLAGVNDGSILQTYATGAVTGQGDRVGGLTGTNGTGASIAQSYATGAVAGQGTALGGLAGRNDGTVTLSYWNTESSDQAAGAGTGTPTGMTGLTGTQMRDASSFTGLDALAWAPADGTGAPLLFGVSGAVGIVHNTVYGDNPASVPIAVLGGSVWNRISGGATSTLAAGANVGTYLNLVDASGVTGSFGLGGAARVVNVGAVVTPATLTLTADGGTMVYGDTVPSLTGYTVTGWKNGQTDALLSGVTVSTDATSTSNVGTSYRTMTAGGTLSGAATGNYTIARADGAFSVTPATLTVTADGGTMVYGDTVPTLTGYTVTGWKNGQTGALLSGVTVSTDATSASNVGTSYRTMTAGGTLSGAATGNYTFARADGAFSVTPATLTVTASDSTMVYGDAVPTLTGYSVTGWKNGQTDALLSGITISTDATSQSNVGTAYRTMTAGGTLSGAAAGNYSFNRVDGGFSVTPATLVVTAANSTMVYGDAVPVLGYTASGWKNGQGDALLSDVTATTDATSLSNVGTSYHTTTAGGTLSGAAAGNYTLSHVGGSFSVTPATLTVTAGSRAMVYGDVVPVLDYSVAGWKNGQTDNLLLGIGVSTDATALSNVGGYRIAATGGTLSGAAVGNYTLRHVDGNLSVTPATLTVTAADGTMIYGDAVPVLGYSVSGWRNGQGDGLLSGVAVSSDATALSNVGTGYRSMTAGGTLSGAAAGNYSFNRVDGAFSVTPATLTVTAADGSMVYGDAVPSLGYSVSGWKNGQSDGLLSGVAVSTDATSLSSVGTGYRTTAAGGTLSGAATGNYRLSHAGGAFSVTPALLTVTASDGSMVYGDAVPVLDYSVMGWKNGQTDTLLSGVTLSTDAGSRSAAGAGYRITAAGGTLSGAASGNYVIRHADGRLTIGRRLLTVAADDAARLAGTANPALTYRIVGPGPLDGDRIDGLPETLATAASPAGAYAITRGGLTAGDNYDLRFTPGLLTVSPQPSGLAAILPARLIEPVTLSGPTFASLGRPAEAGETSGSGSPAALSEVSGPETTGNRKDGEQDVCGAAGGEGCASLPHPANRFLGTFLSVKSP
ncbi:MBG domain-containing protein [Azospirillum sp. CT11-132]|uniref:MBG domain-containing protein n=1 Tax=Azospirillum sp. CT11-132 TaxID=3396317 RepID=UPI0039A6D225